MNNIINNFESNYRNLLFDVSCNGSIEKNRTNVDTICGFNKFLTINLQEGFPILTGREIFFNKAYHEYIWIKEGLTTLTYLHQNNIKWWDSYADDKDNLGKTYGYQLRNFNNEIDQLEYVNNTIKLDKTSRRLHITFWNPSELNATKLPPCYTGMTFMIQNNMLNMSFQLRSSDLMLGLPYDIVIMALFLIEIAEFNELKPNLLGVQITNAHIYRNHDFQLNEYINRPMHKLPNLIKKQNKCYLENYKHEKHIITPLNI
jgi:thymidylate synthase